MEFVQPIRDRKKIDAMKIYLKGKSLRDYLLFTVGISSALRISDILNLRIQDIWNGKSTPSVIELKEKKNSNHKSFPVSKNLDSAIREYINYYKPTNPKQYVFQSRIGDNAPLSRFQALRIIKEAGEAVGIKENLGTHSMRKTWGYWAYKQGYDISLLVKAFGHSSEAMTRLYIGITQDNVDEIYINLNL